MVQISLIKIPLVLPVFFFSFFCASFFLNIHFLVVLSNTYNSQSNFQLFNQLIYQKFYVTRSFFFFFSWVYKQTSTHREQTHTESLGLIGEFIILLYTVWGKLWNTGMLFSTIALPVRKEMKKIRENDSIKTIIFYPFYICIWNINAQSSWWAR